MELCVVGPSFVGSVFSLQGTDLDTVALVLFFVAIVVGALLYYRGRRGGRRGGRGGGAYGGGAAGGAAASSDYDYPDPHSDGGTSDGGGGGWFGDGGGGWGGDGGGAGG